MPKNPELDDFQKRTEALFRAQPLRRLTKGDSARLGELTLEEVASVLQSDEGYYLLLAASGLNRTTLKKAQNTPEAKVRPQALRRAHAIRESLPRQESVRALVHNSVTLRSRDLNRKSRSNLEKMFKERLASEGIPIYMSPPLRKVPGLLIRMRKPDGVAPDPETGEPPEVYLEIKNIRRVADDIQKRLYEIAEVSLEMKLLYGGLQLSGFSVKSTHDFDELAPEIRASLRAQIQKARPVVVAFFLCPRDEAERYRPGAEAFIDRVFFQEEVDECLAFLRQSLRKR